MSKSQNIFVFDLDEVVVLPIEYDKEIIIEEIDQGLGVDFRKKNSLEIMGYTHLLYVGFSALFRWIYDRGDCIYFFSTGIAQRNEELISLLMKRAFGDASSEILKEIKIFSREDCINTVYRADRDEYQPITFFGNKKKKLKNIVVLPEEMSRTLLIDDDPSYMTKGEENNFMHVHSSISYFHKNDYSNSGFLAFHKAFYICGMIDKIIKHSEEKSISLVDSSWSFVEDKEKLDNWKKNGGDLPRYLHNTEDFSIYKQGLKLLQKIDPKLDFYFAPTK